MPGAMLLRISARTEGRCQVVEVNGDLVTSTVQALRAALEQAERPVAVDLSGLGRIDQEGVRLLREATRCGNDLMRPSLYVPALLDGKPS